MTKPSPLFRRSVRTGFSAFRRALPRIAFFTLVYQAGTALLAKPLLGFLMQLFLRLSGDELAFNDGIWKFALTIPGLLAVIVMVGIAILVIYFEFAVIIALARQAVQNEKITLRGAVVRALWSFGNLKGPGVVLLVLYCLVLLPVVNIGVTSSLLPRLTVPNFITGELTKTLPGQVGVIAAVVLVLCLFFALLFVLPAMVLEHCRFPAAAKKSLRAVKAYGFKMLGVWLVAVLLWVGLFLLPRALFAFFFETPSITFWKALAYHGFSLKTPVMGLIWLAATAAQVALMPLVLTLLTAFYLPVGQAAEEDPEALAKIAAWLEKWTGKLQRGLLAAGRYLRALFTHVWRRPFIQKHKKLLAAVLVLLVALAVVNTFFTTTGIHDPLVVGHRGSAYGVENTLEAIQGAIDAGADYTEVDILLSADNVPMVVHDSNLQRLSGQNVNVYDLTAEELQSLTLTQNGYTGRIPTLEETVAYCEGKILLAIEYKLHGHEQKDLIEAVMQVMQTSDFQKNSIYVSLEYDLVAQMKSGYPAYRAGYCVYGNVGSLTPKRLAQMEVDFLLVEEWMVSEDLVKTCRKAWMPVYVWTVNDPDSMEDYLKTGVAGLVTDYPDTAMEILGTMYNLDERVLWENE